MAEIDDLKNNVNGLKTSQAAFNAELSKTLADIQAKLLALTNQAVISPADVEAAAQDVGVVRDAVDANTKTLSDFDATITPAPVPVPAPAPAPAPSS